MGKGVILKGFPEYLEKINQELSTLRHTLVKVRSEIKMKSSRPQSKKRINNLQSQKN